jgi:hypothetical protein
MLKRASHAAGTEAYFIPRSTHLFPHQEVHEAVQGLLPNSALDKVSAEALHIALLLGNRRLNIWQVPSSAVQQLPFSNPIVTPPSCTTANVSCSRPHHSQRTTCADPLAKEQVWSGIIVLAAACHSHDEAKSSGRLLHAHWGTEMAHLQSTLHCQIGSTLHIHSAAWSDSLLWCIVALVGRYSAPKVDRLRPAARILVRCAPTDSNRRPGI